jgi:putative peptidoglycan lipid II flippase
MEEQKKLVKSSSLIALATSLSRLLGLVRESVFAYFLGTSPMAAAFIIAFRIPNLLRQCLAEGSLSASFIPVFSDYLSSSRKEILKMVNTIFNVLLIVLLVIVSFGILTAPFIVHLITLGQPPFAFKLVVNLTRLMFPYLFFVSLAALLMGILNSYHYFFTPALGPVILNLMIISSFFLICPCLGKNWEVKIYGVGIGVLLGGLGQVLIQLPHLKKTGLRYQFYLNFSHPALRKVAKLMLPSVVGLAVTQVNFFVDTMLACRLGPLAITGLNYGHRLMLLPLGVFGVSIANANFPTLARQAAEGKIEELKKTLASALELVFFIALPASVGLIILGKPLVKLIFERGIFDTTSTLVSSQALLFYSLGLFAYMGVKVLVTVFYSLKDTKTPLKMAIVAMAANIILNLILMVPLQHRGLALSTALSAFLNLIGLAGILGKKLRIWEGSKILKTFFKFLLFSCLMGGVCWGVREISNQLWTADILPTRLVKVFIPLMVSLLVYFGLGALFKLKEVKSIFSLFRLKI